MTRKPLKTIAKPPSLHTTVQQTIRQYIVENNLSAGDQLPSENQLSQQLGVSRNLVREAVRGLEAVGIVDIRRGSGLFVNQFSFQPLIDNLHYGLMVDWQELQEMLEIRHALEVSLIGKAIGKMTAAHKTQLKEALAEMKVAQVNEDAFVAADRHFHKVLFASLENKSLLKVLDAFWLTFNKAAEKHQETLRADPEVTYARHAEIVAQVLANDIEAAQVAIDQHYTDSMKRWRNLKISGEG